MSQKVESVLVLFLVVWSLAGLIFAMCAFEAAIYFSKKNRNYRGEDSDDEDDEDYDDEQDQADWWKKS